MIPSFLLAVILDGRYKKSAKSLPRTFVKFNWLLILPHCFVYALAKVLLTDVGFSRNCGGIRLPMTPKVPGKGCYSRLLFPSPEPYTLWAHGAHRIDWWLID